MDDICTGAVLFRFQREPVAATTQECRRDIVRIGRATLVFQGRAGMQVMCKLHVRIERCAGLLSCA